MLSHLKSLSFRAETASARDRPSRTTVRAGGGHWKLGTLNTLPGSMQALTKAQYEEEDIQGAGKRIRR